MQSPYDAIPLVSFGGPERREEVVPFLENVLRGRNVPRERMLAVARHYYRFGGISPIDGQNRAQTAGTHPQFAGMIRQLILERMSDPDRDVCPSDCCLSPAISARR